MPCYRAGRVQVSLLTHNHIFDCHNVQQ